MPGGAEVVWEEPPARSRSSLDWDEVLAVVAGRPETWARIGSYPGETSAYRTARQLRARSDLPPGAWDFVARRTDGGGSALYARCRHEVSSVAMSTEALETVHKATRRLMRARSAAQVARLLVDTAKQLGARIASQEEVERLDRSAYVELLLPTGKRVAAVADGADHANVVRFLPLLVEDARVILDRAPAD